MTMKIAVACALLAGSATAFAPQQQVTKASALRDNKFAGELGAQPPLGFWDPLNFLIDEDIERFERLRYVEVKHGRIAMLAMTGHLVTSSGIRLPGDIAFGGPAFADIKTGLAGLEQIPPLGIAQIVAFIGFLEVLIMKDAKGTAEFPGDFRNGGDFGWKSFSPEEQLRVRGVELNNGRAAQMGILGLMVHEKLDGHPYVMNEFLGYPVEL